MKEKLRHLQIKKKMTELITRRLALLEELEIFLALNEMTVDNESNAHEISKGQK